MGATAVQTLLPMHSARPSRTALGTALRRAAHQLYDPAPLVLTDPIAVPILGPTGLADLEAARTGILEPFNIAMRAYLVARSRYTEDLLAQAVAQGTMQYVLLGAGLDTFAHRNPHPQVRVFEVDHPATQLWKQQLVAAAVLPQPSSLTYVPVDFECESLPDRLADSGFDPDAPAVFAWLGVVPYLTLPAFRATVGYVAARPPGSAIVFDYGQPTHVLPPRERAARELLASRVALAGEPFRLHFTPPEAARELDSVAASLKLPGFFNLEDLGSAELNALYFDHHPNPGPTPLRLAGQSGRILSAWL